MEQQQFVCEDLNDPLHSNQGFRTDRFSKKSSNLNIPDTIIENDSTEISGDSFKIEAHKTIMDNFNSEKKENVSLCANQQQPSDRSPNVSINFSIDHSFIKECERKLLEASSSDEEKGSESDLKTPVNKHSLNISRKALLLNETISTPPSALRKEISLLRNEMAETCEFHDLEMQLMKEEKITFEEPSENYIELFNKYAALTELYSNLKSEYDEYRNKQQKATRELQSETANCLENLCSQLEASDNSLNFSSTSMVSFNGGIRSSTMVEDISEVEATIMQDATILAKDPLSITMDGTFKTPVQNAFGSSKKDFSQGVNITHSKPIFKEVKEILANNTIPLDSEYSVQLLNLETALCDKTKEVEELEQRLFKLEDLCSILQNECERVSSVFTKDNETLKEQFRKKSEQLDELIQKLHTETISLKPSLRDSVIDISGTKLLVLFIETIMESCENVQKELITKHALEKASWERKIKDELSSVENLNKEINELKNMNKSLEKSLSDAESTIATRDEEILMLQSHISNFKQTREDFSSVRDTVLELETKLTLTEAEKTAAENRYKDLEVIVENLKQDLEKNETIQSELRVELQKVQNRKTEIENENANFKESNNAFQLKVTEIENLLKSNEIQVSEMMVKLMEAEETTVQLKAEIGALETEKSEINKRCNELTNHNVELEGLVESLKNDVKEKEIAHRDFQVQLSSAENKYVEIEKENIFLKEQCDNLKLKITEIEIFVKSNDEVDKTVLELKSQIHSLESEKSALEKHIAELQEKTQELDTLVNTSGNRCQELEALVETLKEQLTDKEKSHSNLEVHLVSTNDKISSVEKENNDLRDLCESLQNKLKESEEISKSNEPQLAEIRGRLTLADETILQLKTEIESMNYEKSEFEKRNAQLQESNENVKSEINIIENRCRELDELVKNLKEEIISKELIHSELQSKLCSAQEENLLLKTLSDSLNVQKIELENLVGSKEARITEIEQSLSAAETEILQLKAQIELFKTEKMEIEKEFNSLREKHPELADANYLENESFELLLIIDSLRQKINEKEHLKNQMQVLETAMECKKAEMEAENCQLKESYESLKNQLFETKNTIKLNEPYIDEIKNKLECANDTIMNLNSDLKSIKVEKTELEKLCNELQTSNTDLQNRISKTETQYLGLEGIVDSLKQEIHEKENIRNEIQSQLSTAIEQKSEMEKENLLLLKSNNSLKSELVESQNLIKSYESKMTETAQDLNNAHGTVCTLQEQVQVLDEENIDLKRNYDLLEKTRQDLQTKVVTSENRVQENELIIHNLKQEIEENKNVIDTIQNQLLHSEEQKSDVEKENLRLKELYEFVKNRLTETENLMKSNEPQINELMTGLKSANEKILELESQVSIVSSEKSDLSKAYDELQINKKDLEVKFELLENLSSDLKVEIENLKKVIEEKENVRNELQTQLLSVQENKTELEKKNVLLKEKYDSSEKQLKDAENLIKINETNIKELKEKLEMSDQSLIELRSEVERTEAKKLESEKQLEEVLKNYVDVQKKITESEIRFQDLELLSEKLKQEVDNRNNVIKELQTRLSSVEETINDITKENIGLSEKCNALSSKVTETEDLLKSKESYLTNIETELIDSKESIAQLNAQIKSIEAEKLDLEKQNLKLQEKYQNLFVQVATTEGLCKEFREVIENLKREVVDKENIQNEMEKQLLAIKKENDDFQVENSSLKELCDTLKVKLSDIESELRVKDAEIAGINESLKSASETILSLKAQIHFVEEEKSELEKKCNELLGNNENLQVEIETAKNNPVFNVMQTENNDLKQRIAESDKIMSELKSELDLAKEDQMKNICKVEELIREIEELKKENTGFTYALTTIEETQKNLANVTFNASNESDLPSIRINKAISKVSKVSECDCKETKLVSGFVETITKTFEGVQNELIKKFDSKKNEWETQKDSDIQNLRDQINELVKKNTEQEFLILQTKNSLVVAEESISKLKSELSSIESEKIELKNEIKKLTEKISSLQSEIDTKETIIKGLDELKILRRKMEVDNGVLKQQICESEEVIISLKKSLEVANEEQNSKQSKIVLLEKEIISLKKESEGFSDLSMRMENLTKDNKNLMELLSDLQFQLNLPDDTLKNLMSGDFENKKVFSEGINNFTKTQMEGLKIENKNLQLGVNNLKNKVKELTKLIGESASKELKEELSNNMNLRSKSAKNIDLCVRRLDKLEEVNHNLTELINRILTVTEFPESDKLKLCSVREYPSISKKVLAHIEGLLSKIKEMKDENNQLDEECEIYSNVIKDLKKEATNVWKANKEATEALEKEIDLLKEEKNSLENEKLILLGKIAKVEGECQKLRSSSKSDGPIHTCACGNESKKISELKRAILLKEQKLLELQDLETQTNSFKSQIDYLKTALEREKKKLGEEKEKNRKLQNELNEVTKNEKTESKKKDDNQVLDELRMRGSISGGVVQEFVDNEKLRKLSKDIGILKELCRARYAEIKRLEAENAAYRNKTPMNSNQMDSPIRSKAYNTRSKSQVRDLWKTEIVGKENSAL